MPRVFSPQLKLCSCSVCVSVRPQGHWVSRATFFRHQKNRRAIRSTIYSQNRNTHCKFYPSVHINYRDEFIEHRADILADGNQSTNTEVNNADDIFSDIDDNTTLDTDSYVEPSGPSLQQEGGVICAEEVVTSDGADIYENDMHDGSGNNQLAAALHDFLDSGDDETMDEPISFLNGLPDGPGMFPYDKVSHSLIYIYSR